jgi:hypothetical protein
MSIKLWTYQLKEIFFNKNGVLIDGDFKFGVLLLVFVRFLGGDTGNLYRNVFLCKKSMSVPLSSFPWKSR